MRGVLEPLVAVELQLRSGPLFLLAHGQANGVQHQVDCLLCAGLVGNNAVVVKVPDHGQVQYALLGVDVGSGVRTESWTPRTRRRLNVYERTGRNCAERV